MFGYKIDSHTTCGAFILQGLAKRNLLNWVPDKTFIKISYRLNMRKKLNLKNPKTYTEKLQWLKLYDRNPKYTSLVDKYEVRKYVENRIGGRYLIPVLGA